MSTENTRKGQCLCGAIQITAEPKNNCFGACHCSQCRQWGSGPLLAVECGDKVWFEGEEHMGIYASSEWAERGFCKQCGTHLFYRLKNKPFYAISLGVFTDDLPWEFAEQVFIDNKPPYYSFANTTRNLTEAEAFEQFSG